MISVKVLDVNDNRPLFVKNTYEQNITENLSSGVFVQQVEAVDADLGLNSRVTYAIVSGAQGYFAINNESGRSLYCITVSYSERLDSFWFFSKCVQNFS